MKRILRATSLLALLSASACNNTTYVAKTVTPSSMKTARRRLPTFPKDSTAYFATDQCAPDTRDETFIAVARKTTYDLRMSYTDYFVDVDRLARVGRAAA